MDHLHFFALMLFPGALCQCVNWPIAQPTHVANHFSETSPAFPLGSPSILSVCNQCIIKYLFPPIVASNLQVPISQCYCLIDKVAVRYHTSDWSYYIRGRKVELSKKILWDCSREKSDCMVLFGKLNEITLIVIKSVVSVGLLLSGDGCRSPRLHH